jgi:hypothetical protein
VLGHLRHQTEPAQYTGRCETCIPSCAHTSFDYTIYKLCWLAVCARLSGHLHSTAGCGCAGQHAPLNGFTLPASIRAFIRVPAPAQLYALCVCRCLQSSPHPCSCVCPCCVHAAHLSSAASSMPPIWLYTNRLDSSTARLKICVLYCAVCSSTQQSKRHQQRHQHSPQAHKQQNSWSVPGWFCFTMVS